MLIHFVVKAFISDVAVVVVVDVDVAAMAVVVRAVNVVAVT